MKDKLPPAVIIGVIAAVLVLALIIGYWAIGSGSGLFSNDQAAAKAKAMKDADDYQKYLHSPSASTSGSNSNPSSNAEYQKYLDSQKNASPSQTTH